MTYRSEHTLKSPNLTNKTLFWVIDLQADIGTLQENLQLDERAGGL